ncbi:MAG: response regulator [Myxococcales bacterium]|nr:response regulator [Myxococcales bacterium]
MTRVLIVDDDPGQLRLLARIISVRRRDLVVVTAGNGAEAVERLEASPIDLVLTDLQMPEVNGFELLAWLSSHQPHVAAFTMTAYPDTASLARLRALGSQECFTKPLDVPAVLERLSQAVTEGVRGHVRDISLASFLQLVQMDRKTCTLVVESDGRVGSLTMDEGTLVGARAPNARGDAAAIEIISWPSPAITITGSREPEHRDVTSPLAFLLMEAMRLTDEAKRAAVPKAEIEIEIEAEAEIEAAPSPATDPRVPDEEPDVPAVRMPVDADALAVVETESGRVRSAAGRCEDLPALAQVAASVLRAEMAVIASLGLHDEVRELVLTTPRCWTVIRPVPSDPPCFAMLIFDPHRATLVMERREMDDLVRELETQGSA